MREAVDNDFWGSLTTAEVALDAAREQLHEIKSEAKGEEFAFGDAAVNAMVAISRQEIEVVYRRNIFSALVDQLTA